MHQRYDDRTPLFPCAAAAPTRAVWVPRRAMLLCLIATAAAFGCNPGARKIAEMMETGDRDRGLVIHVGGAGTAGGIGAPSILKGLEDAGYRGGFEVYEWQSITAIDQTDIERNLRKANELATIIRRFKYRHPNVPVDIVSLSAGTGITVFALERLPESVKVESVVLLASSMSSRYDLTRALRRVNNAVYCFHSEDDPVLKHLVPLAGTVDRKDSDEGVAGLYGFYHPTRPGPDTDAQYGKLHNVPWRKEWRKYGNYGGHIGGISREFIEKVVAPLLHVQFHKAWPQDGRQPRRERDENDDRRNDSRRDDLRRDSTRGDSRGGDDALGDRRDESLTDPDQQRLEELRRERRDQDRREGKPTKGRERDESRHLDD